MRALVTGAGGFVGRHLVQVLSGSGVAVRAMVHRSSPATHAETIVADVRDPAAMRRAVEGIDTVFHLAAKVHDLRERTDTGEHHEVNFGGTRNLLEASARAGVSRFVFCSSVAVYGHSDGQPVDESAPLTPRSPYGVSKAEAEQLVIGYASRGRWHASILRPPGIYGPGSGGQLPRMIRAIRRGVFPPLPDFGDRRSLVHVLDVARALQLLATHDAASGKAFNVTDGGIHSARSIYEAICRAAGRKVPRWSVPRVIFRSLALAGDAVEAVVRRRIAFDSRALATLTHSALYSSEWIEREVGFRPERTMEEWLGEEMGRNP